MKLYLVGACVATALLCQAQVMAQAPNLSVEVVTPGHDKWAHLLELSTSLDTADLALHVAPPIMQAEVGPPRYDYRNSRKVERRYNKARRYYKRLNRRDNRELQKQSHRSYLLQRREILRNEKQRQQSAKDEKRSKATADDRCRKTCPQA